VSLVRRRHRAPADPASDCFCAADESAASALHRVSNGQCAIACPGADGVACGGDVTGTATVTVFLSVYVNADLSSSSVATPDPSADVADEPTPLPRLARRVEWPRA
jgi:hypothetical protein